MTFNPRYHPPAVIVNVTRVGLRFKKVRVLIFGFDSNSEMNYLHGLIGFEKTA